jgi:hypothetical protein
MCFTIPQELSNLWRDNIDQAEKLQESMLNYAQKIIKDQLRTLSLIPQK